MKNWDRGKAYMYALVGAYLMYLANQLFNRAGSEEVNGTVIITFAVLFLIIGIALIGYVIYMYFKSKKTPIEKKESDSEKDIDLIESDENISKEIINSEGKLEETVNDDEKPEETEML